MLKMRLLKFYTDAHIDKQVAIQLPRSRIDVVRCEEAGMAEADSAGSCRHRLLLR